MSSDEDSDQCDYYAGMDVRYVLHALAGQMSTKRPEPEEFMDCPNDNEPTDLPTTTPKLRRSSAQFEKTCSALNNLRTQRNTCDMLIVCGDEKLPAHRLILRAGSAYFEAMFSSGMQEASSFEVQFPTIPAKLMSLILDFIYIQQVNIEILSADEIWELLTAAHLLELYPLVEICVGELTKKINFGNWVTMLQGGRKYLSERLVLSVVQYLVQHDLTKDSELLGLDFDCFNSLIMTSSDQNLHSADMLINLILNWVSHNENDRKQYLLGLLSSIDFTSASNEIITSLIHQNNLVKNSIEVAHLLLSKISAVFTDSVPLKTAFNNPKLLIFKTTSVHSFDLKKREWSTHNLPLNLDVSSNPPMAVSDHAVYFTADIKNSRYHSDSNDMHILAFYPHNNCVNAITTHSKRHKFGMVFLNDALYLTGGVDSSREKSSYLLEKYDLKTKLWSFLAKPILRRLNPMIIALNGNLYLFGGSQTAAGYQDQEDQTQIRVVEMYSTSTNQWSVVTVVPNINNKGFIISPCFSKIYLKSPARNTNDVYNANLFEFDPEENTWREVMSGFNPEDDSSINWWLCRSNKPLPFLVVKQGKKFFRVDPRTEQSILITEKSSITPTVDERYSSSRIEDDDFGTTIVFA